MAFDEDLAYGEAGEHIAWVQLLESPKTRQVLDVRKDKYFQEKDIDFLQLDFNSNVNKIEVKTDRQAHKTGNIAFETKSNSNTGCLERSEADYIYYYIPHSRAVIVIKLDLLKGFIIHTKPREVDMGDNARGYLLRIQDLLDYRVAWKKEVQNGN